MVFTCCVCVSNKDFMREQDIHFGQARNRQKRVGPTPKQVFPNERYPRTYPVAQYTTCGNVFPRNHLGNHQHQGKTAIYCWLLALGASTSLASRGVRLRRIYKDFPCNTPASMEISRWYANSRGPGRPTTGPCGSPLADRLIHVAGIHCL